MNHFLKLTKMAINPLKINKIYMEETGYSIILTNNRMEGFFFMWSGYIDSRPDEIKICKINDPCDYKIVTDWLNTDWLNKKMD